MITSVLPTDTNQEPNMVSIFRMLPQFVHRGDRCLSISLFKGSQPTLKLHFGGLGIAPGNCHQREGGQQAKEEI